MAGTKSQRGCSPVSLGCQNEGTSRLEWASGTWEFLRTEMAARDLRPLSPFLSSPFSAWIVRLKWIFRRRKNRGERSQGSPLPRVNDLTLYTSSLGRCEFRVLGVIKEGRSKNPRMRARKRDVATLRSSVLVGDSSKQKDGSRWRIRWEYVARNTGGVINRCELATRVSCRFDITVNYRTSLQLIDEFGDRPTLRHSNCGVV